MNENLELLFKEINELLSKHFQKTIIEFYIIGNIALTMAGIPERGTKDIDVIKILGLSAPENKPLVSSLESNFGKNSIGHIKFGLYIDFIDPGIPFLRPRPDYLIEKKFTNLHIYRLSTLDAVASKVLSYSKSGERRLNDLEDIKSALDFELVKLQDVVNRCEELYQHLEMDARFPEVMTKSIKLLKSLAREYGEVTFDYELPNWFDYCSQSRR